MKAKSEEVARMKLGDWLMIIGIILMLVGLIFLVTYVRSDGLSCVKNPMIYYQTQENTSCWCLNGLQGIKIPLT